MSENSPRPNGLFDRLPKPSLRQRRLIAMCSAAAIVTVGLGAFALLPPVQQIRTAGTPTMMAANDSRTTPPRMLENSAPFSFADLVERVSPAVVTITSETTTTEGDSDDGIPDQFKNLFPQFNFGQRQQQPHRAQPPRDQRGIFQPRDAQRQVEAVRDQIDMAVGQREIQHDLGIAVQ